jgi:hypothetical protein
LAISAGGYVASLGLAYLEIELRRAGILANDREQRPDYPQTGLALR